MKLCEWCDKEMMACNYSKHLNRCFYKVQIGAIKKVVMKLLKTYQSKKSDDNYDDSDDENKKLQMGFAELKNFLAESFNKSKMLHNKIVQNELKDPLQKINEMHLSESTRAW